MKLKSILVVVLCGSILALAACTTAVPTVDVNTFNTSVAQSVAQTQQAAASVSAPVVDAISTTPAPTAEVVAAPTETLALAPTSAPVKNGIWLSFTESTNCRIGYGKGYALVKTFKPGDQVQAIAQSPDGQYLYVTFTDTTAKYCWVYRQFSTVSGDYGILPAFTPYPTSTPSITPTVGAGFTLHFNGISSCGGNYYVRVLLTNIGEKTWQSYKIKVVDQTTNDEITEVSNDFVAHSGCGIDQSQEDLTTGEPGLVSNFTNTFNHDLDNHVLKITVTIYSENGQGGSSMTNTIVVTP